MASILTMSLATVLGIPSLPSLTVIISYMSTLENLLITHERKTLEFKESTKSSLNIIKAVVAFANTAGGTIIIGIQDKTKEVLGIEHILLEEERIANVISDSALLNLEWVKGFHRGNISIKNGHGKLVFCSTWY